MTDRRDSVRKGMASGAFWMVSFRMADRMIALVSTVVLARLLAPDDFGLMALAMAMIAVLDMIGELSFELALIRDQEASEEHYHTAWTAKTIKGLALFAVLNVLAGPAAAFFGDPRLQPVVHVVSITVLLTAVQSIRITDLRKELEFGREFHFRISARLFGFVTTLVLAWFLRDYWALVYGAVASACMSLILSYVMMPYLPRPTLSRFGEIFAFSKWLLAENVFTALTKRAPSLVIGRLAEAQTLGIYAISNQICGMASTELVAPIKRALFPAYSKLVSDFDSLRRIYLDNFAVIVLLAMPVAAGIGLTAEYVVPIFLGDQWLAAIPVMQILAVHAVLRTISSNSRPFYLATNHPRFSFFLTVTDVAILLPALLVAVPRGGAVGAAIALVLSGTAVTLLDSLAVVRLLKVPWTRFLSSIWRTLVSIAVMSLVVIEAKSIIASAGWSSNVLALVASALTGAGVYVTSHLVLWKWSGSPDGAESLLLRFARRWTNRSIVRDDALSPTE